MASSSAASASAGVRRGPPYASMPATHTDLLDRPVVAHLATVRPDGSPQTNVMWFAWDGERIRMTHTKSRQKYRNLARAPGGAVHRRPGEPVPLPRGARRG